MAENTTPVAGNDTKVVLQDTAVVNGKEVKVQGGVEHPVTFWDRIWGLFGIKKNAQSVTDEVAKKKEEREAVKKVEPKKPEEQVTEIKKEDLTPAERAELVEAEKIYQEGLATIKDLIAPSSMEVQQTKIKLGEVYAQSFFVYSYPRYLETNWLAPVVNFDVTYLS